MKKGTILLRVLIAGLILLIQIVAPPCFSRVQIVEIKNPARPAPPKSAASHLLLEDNLTIGTNEKEGGYFFEDIGAVRASEDGTIFVLDRKACTVKVFDRTGRYVRNFGRQGQGPGEFGPPSSMNIISDKEILVSSLGRLSYFSLQGDFLRQTEALVWGVPVPDSEGNMIVETQSPSGQLPNFIKEIKKLNSRLEPIFTAFRYEFRMRRDDEVLNPFPVQLLYAVQKDDSFVWAISNQYVLTVVDKHGRVVKEISKGDDPIVIKDEDRSNILRERAPGAKYEFPKYYPPLRRLQTDDEGRIFVLTYETDEDNSRFYDVFDDEGRYLAKIAFKNVPMFWKNKMLYSRAEDQDGYQRVIGLRVIWK